MDGTGGVRREHGVMEENNDPLPIVGFLEIGFEPTILLAFRPERLVTVEPDQMDIAVIGRPPSLVSGQVEVVEIVL